jgi:IS30 family transposase
MIGGIAMASVFGAMTEERKARIWHLWQQGRPMSEVARHIVKPPATVYSYLLYHGGIKPRVRTRREHCLSVEERESISRGLAKGESMRSIASQLGRAPSTVSREIARNGGIDRYRACIAEKAFLKRSKRPKPFLLGENIKLRSCVTQLLEADWSPEQIAGWLKQQSPDGKSMCVSHETIYKSLFIQTRGVLREELKKHLRTRRMFRHAKAHKVAGRGQIVDAISIRDRPAAIEDRAIPGHWEGDLLLGSDQSVIATVVERRSRFTLLCRVRDKTTASVVASLSAQMKRLPKQLLKTLTWDRGQELASHKKFTVATDMAVYFCDPSSPWQRGTNENTNGLLRQYFPKRTSVAQYTQKQLDSIAAKLNTRPRKTLGFRSPASVLAESLR